MAALVEAAIESPESVGEINWGSPEVSATITRFSRISLLHQYIFAMIAVEHRSDYRKNADLFEEEEIGLLEDLLDTYDIEYQPFARFESQISPEHATSRADDPFYQWFLSQEASFEHLWEKLTDESFHILFANRSFLLKFNRAVAEHLRGDPGLVPLEERGVAGRIRRRPPPAWARSAVFFRDQGRCVLCHVDLSGLLSTDRVDHFDHMVPLADWGTNDACNLQLLCEACNLKKSAGLAVTGNRYSAWWRY